MEDPAAAAARPAAAPRATRAKTNQKQGDQPNAKRPTQPNIPPEVRQWMLDTYVQGQGEIDRAEMHNRYKAFCESRDLPPKDLANFGKIVKNLFPGAGYRRLGGRNQASVSHYAGIVLRHGDPSRAVKSKRKSSSKNRSVSTQAYVQAPPICFVMETPQTLALSKKRQMEGDSHNWLDEFDDYDETDDDDDEEDNEDEAEEDEEWSSLPVVSSQRHKRLQVRTHRVLNLSLNNGQTTMSLMTVVREYRNVYRNELWGLTPTNPASMKSPLIKYVLLDNEGKKERSSLSFSCLLMLCIASFLNGDWSYSRSFYNLAREHLSAISGNMEYDVAAGLVAFGWWVTFYAHTAEEGKRNQLEYIKHGIKICQHLRAYNDEVYWLLLSLESSNTTQKMVELIEESKKQPPYRRSWKNFKNLKRPASMEWAESFQKTNQMFQYVLSSISVMRSQENTKEKSERTHTLLHQLNASVQLEKDLKKAMSGNSTGSRPSTQTFNMLMTFNYGLRAMTYNLLRMGKDVKAAEDLFNFLLGVPPPMMLISIHGLTLGDYVLIKTSVDVLVSAKRTKPLVVLLQYIEDSKIQEPFYWLTFICTYIESKLNALRAAEVATPPVAAGSSPSSLPPSSCSRLPSSAPSPSVSAPSAAPSPQTSPLFAAHAFSASAPPAPSPALYLGAQTAHTPSQEEFSRYELDYHNPLHQFAQFYEYNHSQPSSSPHHLDYQHPQQQRTWSTVPVLPRIASVAHVFDGSSPTYSMPPSNADSPASSPVRLDAKPKSPPFGVKDAVPMPAPLPMTFSRYASGNGGTDIDPHGVYGWSAQIVGGTTPCASPIQPPASIGYTTTMPSAYVSSTTTPTTSSRPVAAYASMMHNDYADPLLDRVSQPYHVPRLNYTQQQQQQQQQYSARAAYPYHMMTSMGPDHYQATGAPMYGHVPRPYGFPDHTSELDDDDHLYMPSSMMYEHTRRPSPFIDNSNVRPLPRAWPSSNP